MNGYHSGCGELIAALIWVLIAYLIGMLYYRLRPNAELVPMLI